MITVVRECPLTGRTNTMQLPISHVEYSMGLGMWRNGMLIQNAFPTLSTDQREFVKTGITPQKWAELFGEDE